jgi:L-threonylcarbamoyladenylate synthase
MDTVVLSIAAKTPDPAAIEQAANVVRAGGLVAFPTETVYGLGANALDGDAVQKIFAAKGRPAQNPLIVHARDIEAARQLSADWPKTADQLAQRFWPGPLTLVLPKADRIPALVTAGGSTVALRVPAHPVALGLLSACQVPLAAPSANRSSQLSPTRAAHVLSTLAGRIDMILDAGPTTGGLESTVLDLSVHPAVLLRPGLVSPDEIEALIGPIARPRPDSQVAPLKSPGMLERHYAPRTPLECVADAADERVRYMLTKGMKIGLLTYKPARNAAIQTIVLPADPKNYAAGMYAALHELDAAGLDLIVALLPPNTEDWLAVRDRLQRACKIE